MNNSKLITKIKLLVDIDKTLRQYENKKRMPCFEIRNPFYNNEELSPNEALNELLFISRLDKEEWISSFEIVK